MTYAGFTIDFPTGQPLPPVKTNTLVVTGIHDCFKIPSGISTLEEHFKLFGPVHSWAPLPSFGRIMIVYYDDQDAERAKVYFDSTTPALTDDWYALVNSCPSRLHANLP